VLFKVIDPTLRVIFSHASHQRGWRFGFPQGQTSRSIYQVTSRDIQEGFSGGQNHVIPTKLTGDDIPG
jgi:hypothetical protein